MEATKQIEMPVRIPENAGVTAVELVTPSAALAMLANNAHNRSINLDRVDEFVRLIDSDRFVVTHQGVALAIDDSVLDGQHRLLAIAKAGKAVWIRVTRGLPREVRWAVDMGRPRRIADEIDIYNTKQNRAAAKDGEKLQAMASILSSFVEEVHATTFVDTMKVVGKLREGMAFVLGCGTRFKLTVAPVRAAVALAHKTNPAKVEQFYKSYITGAELDTGSPILALRNLALLGGGSTAKSDSTRKRKLFLSTLRCIEAFLFDEPLKVARPCVGSIDLFLPAHGLTPKMRVFEE